MLTSFLAGMAVLFSVFADFEVHPRTGEYFASTKVPYTESVGMRFFDLGYAWTPTLVAPIVLCPLGLAVSAVDSYVLSPVWDVLCLPYDALKRNERPEER